MIRLIALLALASTAALAAQTTTINVFVPFADEQPLVGSIIGVDSAATTLAVGCSPGTDSNDCGFSSSQTITQGPSTYAFTMTFVPDGDYSDDGPFTQIAGCQINPQSSSALCSITVISTTDGTVTTASTTMGDAELPSPLPIVITAGAEKLTASPGASETATASATGSSMTAAATTGPKGSSVLPSASASSSPSTTFFSNSTATSSDSTPTTTHATAAGSANTQNMILAGVAALVGAVMVL